MRKSGRAIDITDAQFAAIQARKPAALKRIETYLTQHLGSADPAVMKAFEQVPREYFHYFYPSTAPRAAAPMRTSRSLGRSATAPRCPTISARPT